MELRKLIFILFLFGSVLHGQTVWYISPTGDDATGVGTFAQPWATLYKACSEVTTAGDLIHVNTGHYDEVQQSVLSAGVSIEGTGAGSYIHSHVSGVGVATIRLASVAEGTNGNQTISYLYFDGDNLTTSWGISVLARSNVSIYSCTFVNYLSSAIIFYGRTDTQYLAPSTYAENNKVYSCVITNCCRYQSGVGGTGNVSIQGQKNFRFYDNTTTHNQRTTYTNGNGFKTTGWIDGLTIYGNTFYGDVNSDKSHADSYDFCIELWGSTKSGIEIYDNNIWHNEIDIAGGNTTDHAVGTHTYSIYIHDNYIGTTTLLSYQKIGMIIETDDTLSDVIIKNNHIQNMSNPMKHYPTQNSVFTNIKIQCNIFENIGKTTTGWNQSWGFAYSPSGGATTWTSTYWYFENNTFVAATVAGASESAAIKLFNVTTCTVNHIYIRNNIVRDFEGYFVYSDTYGAISDLIATYNNYYNCGSGISLVVTPTSSDYVTGNITTDPLLVSLSPANYHLQTGSPAATAGLNLAYSDFADYDNILFLNPPSIGAFQKYSSSLISTLTTNGITSIGTTTATSGGYISSDGGASVTARGVCWSASLNPTIADSKTTDGTGTGSFTSSITGLSAGTYYHVRAYATNSIGTAYGEDRYFQTNPDGGVSISGLIKHLGIMIIHLGRIIYVE